MSQADVKGFFPTFLGNLFWEKTAGEEDCLQCPWAIWLNFPQKMQEISILWRITLVMQIN